MLVRMSSLKLVTANSISVSDSRLAAGRAAAKAPSWDQLTLAQWVGSDQLAYMLASSTKLIQLPSVLLPVTAEGVQRLAASVQALADAMRADRIRWMKGRMKVMANEGLIFNAGAAEFPISGLKALAPLKPFASTLWLSLGFPLSSNVLDALATSLDTGLQRLDVSVVAMAQSAWAWLAKRQAQLPALKHLYLHGLKRLDAIALALFCASASCSLQVTIDGSATVGEEVQRVQAGMAAQGLATQVVLVRAGSPSVQGPQPSHEDEIESDESDSEDSESGDEFATSSESGDD